MFDQSYGLRFDIYERIILSEDLPGIEELEEVELIPHIQVISQEEQATLRGHLLLAGLYKGDSEAGESEPLEHWIPVEITVPMNRVSSLDDIAVEIENFDVDLLSTRSLNITGVLSLKGIQAAVQGTNDLSWNDEEITVVHAPESFPEQANGYDGVNRQQTEYPSSNPSAYPPYPFLQAQDVYAQEQVADNEGNTPIDERYEDYQTVQYQEGPTSGFQSEYDNNAEIANFDNTDGVPGEQLHREQVSEQFVTAQLAEQPISDPVASPEPQIIADSNPNVWNFERFEKTDNSSGYPGIVEERAEEVITEQPSTQDDAETSFEEKEEKEEKEDITAAVQETALLSDDVSVQEEPPAKPELKVAFSTKNSTVDPPAGVGFSSLLQSSRTVQEQEIAAREVEEPIIEATEQLAAEDVQWKSLFLGSRQEETPFRKVRLCIVQREETIEAIAERYQLSPRELLLYNRLSEQSVEEGQVLYIP